MKLKPSTLALLAAALLLGGVVYYVQSQPTPQEQQEAAQKLFSFEEGQVQAFKLVQAEQTLSFQKDAGDVWQMIAPEQTTANDASVAYLLNLLATGQRDRTLTVPAADAQTYGFNAPLATIEVTLQDGKQHRLILGSDNFSGTALYAQVDPPATASQTLQVALVSQDFRNAVGRSLLDWKQSASPSPGVSPSPSPGVSSSPEATPSPEGSPEATPSPEGSPSPEASPSPEGSPSPEAISSPSPEVSPSPTPAGTPTPTP